MWCGSIGGRLPVAIRAVPEGSVVPTHNVLVTIANTDPALFWLPSYLETALLRAVWYPTTVATNSLHCKLALLDALRRTSDDPAGQIGYKLHDFGARGVSSAESAALGGLAHLVNFRGSDTLEAVLAGRRWYGEDMAGHSIPAAEHSTITAWGREGELEAYRNMLRQFAKPGAVVACVSDSYDLEHAVRALWGGTLRDAVVQSGATLVVRPDFRRPGHHPGADGGGAGGMLRQHGQRQGLPRTARLRASDPRRRDQRSLFAHHTGQPGGAGLRRRQPGLRYGGGLLQQLDRDTLRFAMKCSAVQVDGTWREVYKAPKTDPGKASKRGRLALVAEGEGVKTVPLLDDEPGHQQHNLLQEVFRDGVLTNRATLAEIRRRADAELGLGLNG